MAWGGTLAMAVVLAVLPNALPQQGCANIICRHQTTAYKQLKVNRKRDQPVLSCLWLSESQNLRCHFAVFYQRVRDVFGHMARSFGRLDVKMPSHNSSSFVAHNSSSFAASLSEDAKLLCRSLIFGPGKQHSSMANVRMSGRLSP